MKATLQHPLVKPLAVVSAAAITATLIAVTNGQSASAVGPNHATELAFSQSDTVLDCNSNVATITTAAYQRLRVVGHSGFGGYSRAFTLKFFLSEGTTQWEIGNLAIPQGATQSTVLDVPGKSLVIRAECPAGAAASIGLLAYGN